MSDKIQNKYIEEYKDVKPSAEFLDRLTLTLEQERANKKRSNIKMVRRVASIAACLVVAVAAGVLILHNTKPSSTGDASSTTDSSPDTPNSSVNNSVNIYGDNTAITGQPIKIDEWDTSSLTPEEYADAMAQMLSSDSLSYILKSDSNSFVGADKISDDEIASLSEMFKNATLTDKADDSAERTYYMAVFEDGLIIKLSAVSDSYVEIPSKDVFLSVN
ncbi:MAG: hypothetical protein IJC65_03365 [Oscillospiraceae bacterium]|nr:hypothetical protein [Oscillospiraceae bacterium]